VKDRTRWSRGFRYAPAPAPSNLHNHEPGPLSFHRWARVNFRRWAKVSCQTQHTLVCLWSSICRRSVPDMRRNTDWNSSNAIVREGSSVLPSKSTLPMKPRGEFVDRSFQAISLEPGCRNAPAHADAASRVLNRTRRLGACSDPHHPID
jgi:hypothetical protein